MGKQKLQGAIFSVRCSRRFFSRPQKWAEKRSEFFWAMMGQKRGATQVLRRSVLPLYVAKQCQRCKNVTLCQRVTETPAKSRLWIMIFTSVFNRQYRRRLAIALRLSPLFRATLRIFKVGQWFYVLVHVCFKTWAYI